MDIFFIKSKIYYLKHLSILSHNLVNPVDVGGHPGVHAWLVCPATAVSPGDDAQQRTAHAHLTHHRAPGVTLAAVQAPGQEASTHHP